MRPVSIPMHLPCRKSFPHDPFAIYYYLFRRRLFNNTELRAAFSLYEQYFIENALRNFPLTGVRKGREPSINKGKVRHLFSKRDDTNLRKVPNSAHVYRKFVV